MQRSKRIGAGIRGIVNQRWKNEKTFNKRKLNVSVFLDIDCNPISINIALPLFLKDVSENKLLDNINKLFKMLKDNRSVNEKTDDMGDGLDGLPEYLLKQYLIENSSKYGIELYEDLDQIGIRKRGDLKGVYKGKEVVIEVEKTDRDFIKHNHQIKIDLVFTLPPKKKELVIPTIYCDKNHFLTWLEETKKVKKYRDNLFLLLYELIRRRARLAILNPSDFLIGKRIEDFILTDLTTTTHFIDLDSKYGTPLWFVYKQHEILAEAILKEVAKKDFFRYESSKKLIDAINEQFRVRSNLLRRGEF